MLTVLRVSAFALDPPLDINQYAHKAWTIREGFFKGAIYAIAQTPDGYLWVGTEFSLERFDGIRSVEWRPPNKEHLPGGPIRSLLAARDGRLWIGTGEGLASWKDGKLTHYPELDGEYVFSLLEDHEGTMWAAGSVGYTEGRLCAIHGGRVECYGKDGSLGRSILSLYEDRRGTLWVGTNNGIWQWTPGPSRFFPILDLVLSFAEDDGGELLISTPGGIKKLVNDRIEAYPLRGISQKFSRLLRARDAGLWVGTFDGGLLHVREGRVDRFEHSDGLSGEGVACLFQDREGSIWVGSSDGLDRFREFAIPTITAKQGLSSAAVIAVLAAKNGYLWLGTQNGLNRWKKGEITAYGKREGLPDALVLSLFQDRAGRVWASTNRGTAYFQDGKFMPVANAPGGFSIVGDSAGDLWISTQRSLFHLWPGLAVEEIPWMKVGRKDFALALLPDPTQGGLWLGFAQGGVAYFKDRQVRAAYSSADGLGEGLVSGFKLDENGTLWVATQGGLSRIRDGRVLTLTSRNGLPCNAVKWVMEDDEHFFWLYTDCGLLRISRQDLDAWSVDPRKTVHAAVFDSADGVRIVSGISVTGPAKSADGKIWFLPGDGVSIIDPRHLPVNKLPPPVHIESIIADDKPYDLKPGMRLPANVRSLRIEFTALSLVAPEKVHFKYKLEGQNKNWHEVINERQATYTNLGPRNYRFRVIASNNSGVWNETGDTLEFSVAPAYYQTTWFYASCVAAFLFILWALYRLRLHQIAREFNAQLDGRVDERMRVARELHDTMLQSFQAALIQMQAARNIFARRPEKTRESLDKAIETAAGAIAEGRSAIQDLRLHPAGGGDLAELLTTASQGMARSEEAPGNPPVFGMTVEGERRDLTPLIQDEVYRIARELLRNAFRHSQAERIEVEIRYESRQLRLHVRDDGKGIEPEILKAGGRAGHYGFPGMRERASRFGGKLEFWSEAGAGTEAVLTVPGAVAYGGSNGRRFSFLRRKKAGA